MRQTTRQRLLEGSTHIFSRVIALCVVPCVAAALSACGQGGRDPVVVRVGGSAIHRAEVDHWAGAIARGAAPGNVFGLSAGGSARQSALRFLILTRRLTGEAAVEKALVSKQAIDAVLAERIAVSDEFRQLLKSRDQTIADAELEVEAELTSEALARILARRAAEVTPRELMAFYRHNRSRFRLAEQRETDLVEGLPSAAAAAALIRRTGAGPRFIERVTNYERLYLKPGLSSEREAILHAIFAQPQGVPSYARLDRRWAAFVVVRIIPPRLLSFTKARAAVLAALVAKRRKMLTGAYLSFQASRWAARTNCLPGYVVQGCRQYSGPLHPEAKLLSVG